MGTISVLVDLMPVLPNAIILAMGDLAVIIRLSRLIWNGMTLQ
jgi:hypothetical protein